MLESWIGTYCIVFHPKSTGYWYVIAAALNAISQLLRERNGFCSIGLASKWSSSSDSSLLCSYIKGFNHSILKSSE